MAQRISAQDEELSREVQRFSMQALELAKSVVDGTLTGAQRAQGRELAAQLPELSARARELPESHRASAARSLADARLDLAFVAADGKVPSSTRLGWYIKERGGTPGA